jgi:hypothetical protein
MEADAKNHLGRLLAEPVDVLRSSELRSSGIWLDFSRLAQIAGAPDQHLISGHLARDARAFTEWALFPR